VAGFTRAAGPSDDPVGYLLLAERHDDHHYHAFRDDDVRSADGRWTLAATAEGCSIHAYHDGEKKLIIVAGRQIVTAERLEVLALGCDREFPDRRPVRDTLAAVRDSGAIPVLPWGFGKWWFGRGKTVVALIESEARHGLFLGDNGGRLQVGPRPKPFALAESMGVYTLPGSDPLPLPREARRAGGYGFRLDVAIDPDRPAQSIKDGLRDCSSQPPVFGRRATLSTFLRNQASLRLGGREASGADHGTD
jgi:hypothetical protein